MPTNGSYQNSKNKRIGIAILKVLAEYAIKSIPVYGVYIEFGLDLFNAVRNEISKEYPVTINEMAGYLRPVTPSEAQRVVDSVLQSPEGQRLISGIPNQQVQDLRARLIRLPSEFDQILAMLEMRERHEAQEAKARQRAAAEATQRRLEIEAQGLKETLKKQLKDKELQNAYKTVEKILAIWPADKEVLRVQAWLEKRLKRGVMHSAFMGGLVGFALAIIGSAASQPRGDGVIAVFAVFTGIGALIGFISGVKRKASRWRKLNF